MDTLFESRDACREATGAVSEEEAMNQIASNIDPSRLRQGAAGYREFMEKVRACSLTQAMLTYVLRPVVNGQ